MLLTTASCPRLLSASSLKGTYMVVQQHLDGDAPTAAAAMLSQVVTVANCNRSAVLHTVSYPVATTVLFCKYATLVASYKELQQ